MGYFPPLEWITNENIYSNLLVTTYFGKVLGFADYTVHRSDNPKIPWTIEFTKIDVARTIFHISLYSTILLVNFNSESNKLSSSVILDVGTRVQLVVGVAIAIFLKILIAYHSRRLWRIGHAFTEVDRELEKLGVLINYPKHGKFVFWFSVITSVVGFIVFLGTFFSLSSLFDGLDAFIVFFSYFFMNLSYTVINCTYMLTLMATWLRFRYLNQSFKYNYGLPEDDDNILSPNSLTIVHTNPMETQKMILKVASLHDELLDIIGDINVCFSLSIMSIVGGIFFFIVFSFYSFYRMFFDIDQNGFLLSLTNIFWCIFYIVYVILILGMANATTDEGRYMAVWVHKAINVSNDYEIIDRLRIFSQQLKQRGPVLTCGLFNFDWTLAYIIVGAVATYLVILIQFESSMPPATDQPPMNG